jgi:hypothetical protein
VRRLAASIDLNPAEQPILGVEHGERVRLGRQAADLDLERLLARPEADVAFAVRAEKHDRLAVPRVPVAAGGFDQVAGAVGAERPGDLVAVAVLRNGDVQGENAGPRHPCAEPHRLRAAEPRASRLARVGDGGFVEDFAVGPHQNRPQLGGALGAVAIAFFHFHHEFAGCGQEVDAAGSPNPQRHGRLKVVRRGAFCTSVEGEQAEQQRENRKCASSIHGGTPFPSEIGG